MKKKGRFLEKEKNILTKVFPIPEFGLKDVLQIIIGATILAVPIAFTEETWRLGESLPLTNIIIILFVSLLFIGFFAYYNYHTKKHFKKNSHHFFKRVFSTYILSFLIVTSILYLIGKAPWSSNWIIAFKRTVLVTLPSCMSASIADTLR